MGAFSGSAFLGGQGDFEGVRAAERDRLGEGLVVGNSINCKTMISLEDRYNRMAAITEPSQLTRPSTPNQPQRPWCELTRWHQ